MGPAEKRSNVYTLVVREVQKTSIWYLLDGEFPYLRSGFRCQMPKKRKTNITLTVRPGCQAGTGIPLAYPRYPHFRQSPFLIQCIHFRVCMEIACSQCAKHMIILLQPRWIAGPKQRRPHQSYKLSCC